MSLSAMLFGQDSAIHKVTNIMGLGIPGLLHKAFMPGDPKMAPQTLGELSQQTAKEGDPRPIVYGIGRPIGGNIMYMSQPVKRMVKTYVGKAGGKGGGKKKKQYQDVEHVYRYYAVRVCEGPITGFRRIWRNGALVYDARKGSDWGAKNNHLFFQNYRLYTGSWDQMPDSMMQSRWGMDIPAHRGTAYLVADNEDLTDFGGAIPQWQFEVVRSEGFYLTSRPYNLEGTEELKTSANSSRIRNAKVFIDNNAGLESMTSSASASRIQLRSSVFTHVEVPEELNTNAGATRIRLHEAVIDYVSQPIEQLNTNAGATRIRLHEAVIDYVSQPIEQLNTNAGATRIRLHEN